MLHLKFDLLFAPFVEEQTPTGDDNQVDLMNEVHKLLPADPVYSIVATQNIVIDKATSGIHSYYPVKIFISMAFSLSFFSC
jgi:hypothetical protein